MNNIVGDVAASAAFRALNADGFVWTPDTLDALLARPKSFVAKTKMSFSGLKKESDRRNVISFLAGNALAAKLDLPSIDAEQATPPHARTGRNTSETKPVRRVSKHNRRGKKGAPASAARPLPYNRCIDGT